MSRICRGKVCTFEVSGDCPMCIIEKQGNKAVKLFLDKYEAFGVCPKHFKTIEDNTYLETPANK